MTGEPVTWYLATCQACTPVLPQPFTDEAERDQWADAHWTGTGHVVTRMTQVRPQ